MKSVLFYGLVCTKMFSWDTLLLINHVFVHYIGTVRNAFFLQPDFNTCLQLNCLIARER